MKQTRFGVFETNSSSTHSITIVSKNEFNKWENGKLLFDKYEEKLVPIPEDYKDEDEGEELQTYRQWKEDVLENFIEEYTTTSGDRIVAFGQYGFDY